MLLSSIAYVLYFVPDLSREWFKLHQSSKKSKVTLLYYFDLLLVVCRRGHRSSFRIVIEWFYSKLSEVIIVVKTINCHCYPITKFSNFDAGIEKSPVRSSGTSSFSCWESNF